MAHGAASMDSTVACPRIPPDSKLTFTWRIDNFLAFKDILETRKVFSKFFTVGGCDLRIGVYESFDTLCIYLESEAPAGGGDPQAGSFWVRYRIAALSQRAPETTEWKESSICTRAWNNSVLQFIKIPEMLGRSAIPRAALSASLGPLRACAAQSSRPASSHSGPRPCSPLPGTTASVSLAFAGPAPKGRSGVVVRGLWPADRTSAFAVVDLLAELSLFPSSLAFGPSWVKRLSREEELERGCGLRCSGVGLANVSLHSR